MKLLAFYNFSGEIKQYYSFRTMVDSINDNIKKVVKNKIQTLYDSGDKHVNDTVRFYLMKNDKTQVYSVLCEAENRDVLNTIKLGYLENNKSLDFLEKIV